MNAIERYELKAAAFQLHTHYFPPGKDSACSVQLSEEEICRARGAWDTWISAYGAVLDCILNAVSSRDSALREERKDMLEIIRKMDEAMNMQECRELETFHIPRATAYKIWSDARALAKEFLP